MLALALVFLGAGCAPQKAPETSSSTPSQQEERDADEADAAEDDSVDVDASTLDGTVEVNACNVTKDYCADITADVYYDTVLSADWDGIALDPTESYRDFESCYFVDFEGDTWLFYY